MSTPADVELPSGLPGLLAARDATLTPVTEPGVLLDDEASWLLVDEGAADVFAVGIEDDRPHGHWSFLYRAEAGTVVASAAGDGSLRLMARLTPGSRASLVERSALSEAGRDAPDGVAQAIDASLGALAAQLQTALPPRAFHPLEAGTSADLAAGATARPVDGAAWIGVDSGAVDLTAFGTTSTVAAGGEAYLTETAWIVASEASRIDSISSSDLAAEGSLVGRAASVTAAVLASMTAIRAREDEQAHAQVRARKEHDAALFLLAEEEFSSVLQPELLEEARMAQLPPAMAVATLVGKAMHVEMEEPGVADLSGNIDAIGAIARASRVRTRQVRLDEGWFRDDSGPLVGYLRATDAPVALLQPSLLDRGHRFLHGDLMAFFRRSHYVLVDPAEHRTAPVDETVARELKLEAVSFSRPLPERPVTGRDLVRIGIEGSHAELGYVLVCTLAVAALGLLTPILTGKILGQLVPRAAYGEIAQFVLILLIAAVAAAVLSVFQNIAALRVEGRIDLIAQSGVWDRLLALPASFFRQFSVGDLSNAALGINAIRDTLSGVAVQALLSATFLLVNFGLMAYYSIGLSVVALVVVSVSGIVWVVAGLGQVKRQREIAMQNAHVQSVTFQLMSGVPKIRVAAAEERAFAYWADSFTRVRNMIFAARVIQNRVITFNATYAIVSLMAIFGYVGFVMHGNMPIGTFLAFNVAFTLFVAATLQLTAMVITVLLIVPLVERLRPILGQVPEVDQAKGDPGELTGRVAVDSLAFRYAPELPPVLQDITFSAEPGEFVAVVGQTGCGKSTLLRLLLGFETPEHGIVSYDGQDLASLDAASVRRQCGVVLQLGQVMSGDVLSNIVGSGHFTVEDAWDAAEMAGLKEDIENMPMGMNTLISEGGSTMSGGQRQRLMIARALIGKPRIVFFDEATSALDNKTQEIVTDSMRKLNATRIVIAHRLSTIRDADKIVVLEAGYVVQTGTFDELMAQDGLFRELAARQIA